MMVDSRLKYADSITLDRIRFLHPDIREQVMEWYLTANYRLLGKGVRLRFACTIRTNEEQDALYAKGRTKLFDARGARIGKVTNAKAGQSIHNYGLAWDIVLLIDADGDGSFEKASWDINADWDGDMIPDWMEVVNYFKKQLGVNWGGDWKFQDKPHFQMDFGMGWRDMRSKLAKGDYVAEVIDGKAYKWVNI
jgi:peptidoglycan L-alanyl-D-glutamate endopeptidase CwlK